MLDVVSEVHQNNINLRDRVGHLKPIHKF
jgi:hypothetical protein